MPSIVPMGKALIRLAISLLRPSCPSSLHDFARSAVVHPPSSDREADIIGASGLFVGGICSGKPECSVVGDQHFPREPVGFSFLVAAEPTLPLVGKRNVELVLQDDVGEFVAHGGATTGQGLSIVFQNDHATPVRDQCPGQCASVRAQEVITRNTIKVIELDDRDAVLRSEGVGVERRMRVEADLGP